MEITTRPSSTKKLNSTSKKQVVKINTILFNEILTAHDKAVIIAATPSSESMALSDRFEADPFAMRIAVDRNRGMLSGEIDADYINSLIEQQRETRRETIKNSTLARSLAFLQQERDDFFRRIASYA